LDAQDGQITEMVKSISKGMSGSSSLLAVRSSSTLEDLDKMAGAGLFDSILNVNPKDIDHLK
jgi:phosphoenolpyruvate synthase/pyruvate phosphate dikinase